MLQIKVFGTTPPCVNCKRAEEQAKRAAEKFPGQVEVIKLDIFSPEAEFFDVVATPLVVIGDETVGMGRIVPADKLIEIIEKKLGG